MIGEPDLSLVTSEALIQELKSRYDVTLFCYERDADADSTTTAIEFGGPLSAAIGLAVTARARLVKQAMDDTKEDDGESADAM